LLAIFSLLPIFVQPLWGMLGDVYNVRRLVLSVACLGTGLSSLAFPLGNTFSWMLVSTMAFTILRAPILPLGNALTFDFLERKGREGSYGVIRLWGSFGFAVASFLVGTFVVETALDFLPYLNAGLLVILAALIFSLPDAAPEESASWLEGLRLLPQRPMLALFLLGVLLIGGPLITAVQYLSTFMTEMGAAGWVTGLAVSSMAILEIPLMLWTPTLMERFRLSRLLMLGVLLTPLRWTLLALVQQPLLVLPIQILHSFAISGLLVVGATYVDKQLPPRWRATGQGLLTTAFLGIGPTLGQFATGLVYDAYGLRVVWWGFAAVSVLGIGLLKIALDRLERAS
jgi:PPP family 3-phenylpropionic acid transporter